MYSLLLAVIYLIFISLGLPDSLLGSGWPTMQVAFGVPSSYAGYVSMSISFMTIISALISPRMIRRFHTKWIVIVSILLPVDIQLFCGSQGRAFRWDDRIIWIADIWWVDAGQTDLGLCIG